MRPWLELLRISNLPTVWSNLIAGAIVCSAFDGRIVPWQLLVVLVAGSALYLGGMVLNDVFDLEIDTRERPSRPLPSGRVSKTHAALGGWGLVLLGGLLPWTISIATGVSAVVLAGLVVLYDRIHARTAWSVLVMAACRAGLYLLAAFMVSTGPELDAPMGILRDATVAPMVAAFVALPVFIHVASFSIVARFEVSAIDKTCPACQYPVPENQSICPECGEAADVEARRNRAERRLDRLRGWCGSGTIVLLLPFVGCCGMVLLVAPSEGFGEKGEAGWALALSLATLVGLGAHLVGTTAHLARNPRAVGRFVLRSIAAMSLYDAAVVAVMLPELVGRSGTTAAIPTLGLVACLLCFGLVRWAHRRIPGT